MPRTLIERGAVLRQQQTKKMLFLRFHFHCKRVIFSTDDHNDDDDDDDSLTMRSTSNKFDHRPCCH